jgi:hypothetical protein
VGLSRRASGYYKFSVPAQTASAIVGLSSLVGPIGYNDIDHGFLVEGGKYLIIENGARKTAFASKADNWVFYVVRVEGTVYYLVDDGLGPSTTDIDGHTLPAELLYTSTEPSNSASWLKAAMLVGGDRVNDAAFVYLGGLDDSGEARFRDFYVLGSDSGEWAFGRADLLLGARGSDATEAGEVRVGVSVLGAEIGYAAGVATLPQFSTRGDDNPLAQWAAGVYSTRFLPSFNNRLLILTKKKI